MEEEDDVWDKFTPTSELVSSRLGVLRKRYEMPYEVESEEKEEESEATEFYLKLEELERREREEGGNESIVGCFPTGCVQPPCARAGVCSHVTHARPGAAALSSSQTDVPTE